MNAKAIQSPPLAPSPDQAPHELLWALIHDIRFALMTTRHRHGPMRSRPLAAQNRTLDESGRLYFLVPLDGELADEILAEPQVNLVYAAPDRGRYVSVAGDAGFVYDEARRARLFPTLAKAWFPQSEALGLLEVRIEQAESWDAATATMRPVFQAAVADSDFGALDGAVLRPSELIAPAGDSAYVQ